MVGIGRSESSVRVAATAFAAKKKPPSRLRGGKAYRQGGRATLGHGLPEDTSRMLWMFAVTDISINFHDALDATL